MIRLLRTAFLAVIPLLVAFPAKSQTTGDMAAGLTPYQSFHGGDIDSVNLSNGSVVLHIPLVSYPQRGGHLTLDYQFFVNSKWIQDREVCPPESGCYFAWGIPLSTPVAGYEGIIDTQAIYYATKTYQISKGDELNEFGIVTSDSAVHPLGVNNSSGEVSLDVTGFFANGSTSTFPTLLMDRNGIQYPQPPSTVGREDPNGNQLVWNSTRTVLTDTVGRTISNPTSYTNFSACGPGALTVTSAALWTIPSPSSGTMQFIVCYAEVPVNIPAGDPNGEGASFSESMVQTIVLPNNTTWNFQYSDRNSGDPSTVNYGMLTQITMPTGGTISYTYETLEGAANSWTRWVTSRTVNANDGTGAHRYSYIYNGTTTTVKDPLGNETVHTFTEFDGTFDYLYETEVQYYQGWTSLLKTVNTAYNTSGCTAVNYEFPGPRNLYPTSVITTWPNGQVSETTTTDDSEAATGCSYGNLLTKSEYDYGSGAPGALLRTTTNQYEAFINSAYLTNNLLTLPSSVQITDGGGTQRAYTTYNYDEYALQTSGLGASQQLDTAPADGTQRGNQTSVHRWLNGSATATTNCNISVTNGYLVSYATYNNTGTVYQSTDSCGSSAGDSKHTTKYSYSSTYEDAYPTTITNPLSQSTTMAYDLNSGLVTSIADLNNQNSSFTYDNMGRIATASYPDGGSATITHQEATFPYSATLTKKITSSLSYVTTNVFDGLGRVSQSQLTSDPSGTDYTDTTYDADGREYTVSNPYRTKTDPTYGITSSVYDALGRICVLIPPDGTAVANTSCPTAQPSNDVFTTYSGSGTTVTDQQGISRKSQTDGLGRVTTVWEDPTDLNYETVYTYDALDDLATVVQGGSHNRTFVYDSLSRLTSSTNPESGTATYTYDADSNVITKEDARSITITHAYDALNRMTGKTYSNGDPAVTYTYDQSACLSLSTCYNIGRRTAMTDAGGSENWAYDKMGREWAERRVTNSITMNTAYTYNLDGSLATLNYPSGRVITYANSAAARPLSAIDTANSINYATFALYSPAGGLSSVTNGASLISTMYYNTRLQPCRISVKSSGSTPTSCTDSANIGNILDYTYNFSLGTSDNGNVMGITNNVDATRSQSFTYDHLNRILTAETTSTFATSPAHCWGEAYVYDNATTGEFGNLTNINAASSAYTGCTQESLSVTALSNNQLSATGFSYDASGNLGADGRNNSAFNAESQIKSVSGLAGVTYTYDGDGHRVEKSNGKLYWYGTGSDPLIETDLSGNLAYEYIFFGGKRIARRDSSNNVVYYVADHLGTSRVVISSTGAILDQSDFYPFGGERIITASSGNTYKFTSKERDSESNLDNFGARYDSSILGRFMSSDPLSLVALPGDAHNPQSWNAYSYVLNSPLNLTDPDGTLFCRPASDEEQKGGAGQICITDTEFINGGDQYRNQGYQHYYSNLDSDADRALYKNYVSGATTDITSDYFFYFPALFSGVRGLYSLGRLAVSGIADLLTGAAEEEGDVVIGKVNPDGTLKHGTLQPGERQLELPKQSNPKANWAQNSGKLREAMSEGKPIRDASSGVPGSDTGFLRAERNLLQDHGWTLQGDTWFPPNR